MKKEVKFYLTKLIKTKNIIKEKGKYFIIFDEVKPFQINSIIIKNLDKDKIIILQDNNIIFEYWINQDRLIPPWETNWFQLKDNFLLKLKDDLLKDLINKAINKAENIFRLSKILNMSYPTFYNFVNNKKIKMISVKKIKSLLYYLNIPYDHINSKIDYTKKGSKISIKNPKFPINLLNVEGANLLGHIVSDGWIHLDKKARNTIRTCYSTSEEESINQFIKIINNLYGEVFILKGEIRNCIMIRIGSSIIGESLLKVGGILGHKAKVNEGVPWLIKYGNVNLKKSYLKAVFEDESSVYYDKKLYNSYIILSRYRHLKNLTNSQKDTLNKLEKDMKSNKFPTRHINQRISIKMALEKIKNDINLIQNIKSPPNLLLEESNILNELGIENRLFGRSLNKNFSGSFSVGFDLFINKKESIKKFYKEIGYSLEHKKNKLQNIIGGEKNIKII
ncbi:MAG: hypothetical protein KJ623_02135 [Nanoarchaeota archaeon]|nr:hypothetical protein [Nanoarchaeota archaeon]MBU0962776.1 hypothetical protein [Nanoarchaeota archaeon]